MPSLNVEEGWHEKLVGCESSRKPRCVKSVVDA